MRDMDVDSGSLRQAKINIGQSAQDTDAALAAFVAELESHGEPWGNDDLGTMIGLSYQGIFDAAMECFNSNLDVIDDYAESLGNAADEYDRTDQENADLTQKAQANLPDLPL
jgi:hypothetical protein